MQIKEHGEPSVAIAIDLQLVRLAEALNVKHNLKGGVIKTIVYDLMEKYPNETMEDFLLVFKRMRQGYYGEDYHLLNQASIFKCVALHLDEKWAEHERQLNHEKAERLKAESFSLSDEELMKAYGIAKDENGKLVRTIDEGTAVGAQPQKDKQREKDEGLEKFKAERMRKRIIHINSVEGQKELLNQTNGDQTQSGIETTEPGGTDEAGAVDE